MGKYSNAIIEWENGISEWGIEVEKINKLETKQDIVKYYLEWRGWGGDKHLMESLLYFIATLD
jgi:hypothetical protein